LFFDLDDNDYNIQAVKLLSNLYFSELTVIIYSTASSMRFDTDKGLNNGKRWRLFIPLLRPIDCDKWLSLVTAINTSIEGDPCVEKVAQIAFVPNNPALLDNRGATHYEYAIIDGKPLDGDNLPGYLNPKMDHTAPIKPDKAVSDGYHKEGGTIDIIRLYNQDNDIKDMLTQLGYKRPEYGEKWGHPDSESGKPSVQIIAKGMKSQHYGTNDKLFDFNGSNTHDCFDLYCFKEGLSSTEAIKKLSKEIKMQDGTTVDSYNKKLRKSKDVRQLLENSKEVQASRAVCGIDVNDKGNSALSEGELLPAYYTPHNEPIPVEYFPDRKKPQYGKEVLKNTIENLVVVLRHNQIEVRFNVISHELEIKCTTDSPNKKIIDNAAEADLYRIASFANRSNLPTSNIQGYLTSIGEHNKFNPVVSYFDTLPQWDGADHIKTFASAFKVSESDRPVADYLIKLWLIQCVASADGAIQTSNHNAHAKYEHILVLIGSQGINKTSTLNRLIPDSLKQYFKDGVLLNPSDKDSVAKATSNWIVELGELDATFRKADIAHLKAFFSEQRDTYRQPYAKTTSSFLRCTSFCASVNSFEFLHDETGNRRFWPIHAVDIADFASLKITCDQIWSQAYQLYKSGEQWWPTNGWENYLNTYRNFFTSDSQSLEILELIRSRFKEFTDYNKSQGKYLSATEVGQIILPDEKVTKAYTNRISAVLRKINTKANDEWDMRRSDKKWRMPARC